jgi:hypothetical protein
MKANQEVTEAYPEIMEVNPKEFKSIVVHPEVSKEDAAVETGRALNKWHGDQNLATGHRRKPKKRIQGNGGCQKKLATAHRRMTHRAGVARRKGHGCKGQNKDSIAERTQKG